MAISGKGMTGASSSGSFTMGGALPNGSNASVGATGTSAGASTSTTNVSTPISSTVDSQLYNTNLTTPLVSADSGIVAQPVSGSGVVRFSPPPPIEVPKDVPTDYTIQPVDSPKEEKPKPVIPIIYDLGGGSFGGGGGSSQGQVPIKTVAKEKTIFGMKPMYFYILILVAMYVAYKMYKK